MVRISFSMLDAVAALAMAGALASAVQAQDYPNKPIRVIAGSGPGGISDIFIRVMGDELSKRWGQPLIVENRAGGAFNIAGRACAEAAPDGYTICILPNEPVTYNKHLFRNLAYDPETQIAPVTLAFFMTQALVINSKLNVKSVDELVAHGKANPKTLNYTAPAAALVLFIENLNRQHGLDIVRVPFRSGGESVNGVLSGVSPITFIGIGNMMPHLRAGSITGLIVDGDKRTPLLPDVPAITEIGYKEPLTRSYFGLYAPAGMAKAQMEKIAATMREVASDPAFRSRNLTERGLEPVFNGPDEFAEFLRQDRITAKKVVDAAGLQPQ
jgi:tripartite-type tricarboxylate transporter receptor subunit TctC